MPSTEFVVGQLDRLLLSVDSIESRLLAREIASDAIVKAVLADEVLQRPRAGASLRRAGPEAEQASWVMPQGPVPEALEGVELGTTAWAQSGGVIPQDNGIHTARQDSPPQTIAKVCGCVVRAQILNSQFPLPSPWLVLMPGGETGPHATQPHHRPRCVQDWTVSSVPPPPMFEAEPDLASQKDAFNEERAFLHAQMQRAQKRLARVRSPALSTPVPCPLSTACFRPLSVSDVRSATGSALHRSPPASRASRPKLTRRSERCACS